MGSSTSSQQTSGLSGAAAPYLQGYGQLIQNFAQRPYQNYQGPRVADLSPLENQAIGGYSSVLGSAAPAFGSATNMLQSTLNGQGGNPFTADVVQRVQTPVIQAYDQATAGTRANFNDAGNVGSARQNMSQDLNDTNLARGLGDATGQLYANAYENERNRQMSAATALPSIASGASGLLNNALQAGGIQQNQQQSVINALYGDWQNAYNYPQTQLQGVAGAIGPLFGAAPRTTTATGSPPDPVQQGLGIVALGNQLFGGNSGSSKNNSGTGV